MGRRKPGRLRLLRPRQLCVRPTRRLPTHYTVSQWDATEPIPVSDLEPGDLVFFNGLGHVGIYIGSGQFIHAPHTGTVVQVATLAGYSMSVLDGARRVR